MTKRNGPWQDGRRAWERLESWRERVLADAGASPQDALGALTDVGALRRLLDETELEAVRSARGHRRSWAEIATRLGVTRQSAWERWRDLDENLPPAGDDGPRPSRSLVLAPPDDEPDGPEQPQQRDDEQTERRKRQVIAARAAADAAAAEAVEKRGRRRRSWKHIVVPSVLGRPWEDARDVLTRQGFFSRPVALGDEPGAPLVDVEPAAGMVVSSQAPEAGAFLDAGATVLLWVTEGGGSAGDREPRRPLPDSPPARALRLEADAGPSAGVVSKAVG